MECDLLEECVCVCVKSMCVCVECDLLEEYVCV